MGTDTRRLWAGGPFKRGDFKIDWAQWLLKLNHWWKESWERQYETPEGPISRAEWTRKALQGVLLLLPTPVALFSMLGVLLFSHGVRLSPLSIATTVWPQMMYDDDDDDCGAIGGMRIGRGNQSTRSATLSTINPTWPDKGSKPGHRGGKPATNCLSYGTALYWAYFCPKYGGRRSSERSVTICHTTAHQIPEDSVLRNNCSLF
jgi:hypothetical protein